jgi:uncharacterized protein YndB with AHSA1/START domain
MLRPRRPPLRPALAVALLLACQPATTLAQETSRESLMEGKEPTGRSIDLAVLVDGSPARLFELWTTRDGVNDFFGSDARIEPRLGGLYEIGFDLLPNGERAGPRGTRILRFEPGEALAFEWTMPPFAEELNTRPLPTWVEVRFEELSSKPERTLVRVSHRGFGTGELWDRCYDYFQRNWFDILFRLKLHCAHFE